MNVLIALALLQMTIAVENHVAPSNCPMLGTPPGWHPPVLGLTRPQSSAAVQQYAEALADLDIEAVVEDIKAMLTDSQDFWPADFGNYGPMMIRLAWHCAGSYRESDGLGGCDGARIRFDYERSWDDNTNLDKATRLLQPIKMKYGLGLSWGDLIILTADTFMEAAGVELLGTCLGRVDETSGFWSEELGPSEKQNAIAPCEEGDGTCEAPFGAAFVSHIYVNPGGINGDPNTLEESAAMIRNVFGRMGMNDRQTVALIGGGHAFGKVHGACPEGAGPNPVQQPWNSWPGLCGSGKAEDTATSGYEGAWTETPTVWSNLYFQYLRDFEFEQVVQEDRAGKTVWQIAGTPDAKVAPDAHLEDAVNPIMMLTTDVALTADDDYLAIVNEFAGDLNALTEAFADAWYKLTTRDMGPYQRCAGPLTPDPQSWQDDFEPEMPEHKDVGAATAAIQAWFEEDSANVGDAIWLAGQCANTFRVTDYKGGCNGASIRFEPEYNLAMNIVDGVNKLEAPLSKLAEVQAQGSVSLADLIVLAGNLAVNFQTGMSIRFCPGRLDADGGSDVAILPWLARELDRDMLAHFMHGIKISGLTTYEAVAWMARMHLENPQEYYNALLSKSYSESSEDALLKQYEHQTAEMDKSYKYVAQSDMFLTYQPELLAIVREFAMGSGTDFYMAFGQAWEKLMNADRFSGATSNFCTEYLDAPSGTADPCVGLSKDTCKTEDKCAYSYSGMKKSACKEKDWCDHTTKYCSSTDVCVGLSQDICKDMDGCGYSYGGLSRSECKELDGCDYNNKYCSSL